MRPDRRPLPRIRNWPAFLALWGERARASRVPGAPKVVSTFAGAGGSSTGYRMAGAEVVLATDWWRPAAEAYRANWPGCRFLEADITGLRPADLAEAAGLAPGELDVLDGSPPCQGFSTAGKRQLDDPRNRLFLDFCRMLEGLQPKAFVMENVSGVVKGPMRLLFREITLTLAACGYDVRCRLVDASWLGVAQVRKRLIWTGTRRDLGLEARHPVPLWRQPSVMDAIGDLIAADAAWIESGNPGWSPDFGDPERPASALTGRRGLVVLERDTERRIAAGRANPSNVSNAEEPAQTLMPSWRTKVTILGEAGGRLVGMEWPADGPVGAAIPGTRIPKLKLIDGRPGGKSGEVPAPTMRAGRRHGLRKRTEAGKAGTRPWMPWRRTSRPAGLQAAFRADVLGEGEMGAEGMHHGEYAAGEASGTRRLTTREVARLQAFPDWYEFGGTRTQQQVLVGNAVPPLMAAAIGMALFESAFGFSLPYYHSQEADALAGVGGDLGFPDPDGQPAHAD